MPGLEQLRWGSGEDAHAGFSGQAGDRREGGREGKREQIGCRDRQTNVFGPILRLLNRTAVVAILGRLVRVSGFNRATEKFQTGNGFKLTMRRDGQPEERCQGK